MLFGHELRKQSTAGGEIETSHSAQYGCDEVNGQGRVNPAKSKMQQQRRTGSEANIARHQETAAIKAVDGMARGKKEHDSGQELRETDKAEIERTFGDFVNLPADGYRLHFERDHDAETRNGERGEIGIAEGDASGKPGVGRGGHECLLCHKSEGGRAVRSATSLSPLRG